MNHTQAGVIMDVILILGIVAATFWIIWHASNGRIRNVKEKEDAERAARLKKEGK